MLISFGSQFRKRLCAFLTVASLLVGYCLAADASGDTKQVYPEVEFQLPVANLSYEEVKHMDDDYAYVLAKVLYNATADEFEPFDAKWKKHMLASVKDYSSEMAVKGYDDKYNAANWTLVRYTVSIIDDDKIRPFRRYIKKEEFLYHYNKALKKKLKKSGIGNYKHLEALNVDVLTLEVRGFLDRMKTLFASICAGALIALVSVCAVSQYDQTEGYLKHKKQVETHMALLRKQHDLHLQAHQHPKGAEDTVKGKDVGGAVDSSDSESAEEPSPAKAPSKPS